MRGNCISTRVLALLVLVCLEANLTSATAPKFQMEGNTNDVVFFGVRPDCSDDILDPDGRLARNEFYSDHYGQSWNDGEMQRQFIIELNSTKILKWNLQLSRGGHGGGTGEYAVRDGRFRLVFGMAIARRIVEENAFSRTEIPLERVDVHVQYYSVAASNAFAWFAGPFAEGTTIQASNGVAFLPRRESASNNAVSAFYSIRELPKAAFEGTPMLVGAWDRFGAFHQSSNGQCFQIGPCAGENAQFDGLSWSDIVAVVVCKPTEVIFRNVRVAYPDRPAAKRPVYLDSLADAKQNGIVPPQSKPAAEPIPPHSTNAQGAELSAGVRGLMAQLTRAELLRGPEAQMKLRYLAYNTNYLHLPPDSLAKLQSLLGVWTNAPNPIVRVSAQMIALQLGDISCLQPLFASISEELQGGTFISKHGIAPSILLSSVASQLTPQQIQTLALVLHMPNNPGHSFSETLDTNRVSPERLGGTHGSVLRALGSNASPAAVSALKEWVQDDRLWVWWRAVEMLPPSARSVSNDLPLKVRQRIALVHGPDTRERWSELGRLLTRELTMNLEENDGELFEWFCSVLIARCDRKTATDAFVNYLSQDLSNPRLIPGNACHVLRQINAWHGTKFAEPWCDVHQLMKWLCQQDRPVGEWRENMEPILKWHQERRKPKT